jgi:HD-GYP domain-containing protein (c-di-GMP phosphodiesterase class II)
MNVEELQDTREPRRGGFSVIDEISRAIIRADDLPAITCLILDLAIGYTDAEKGSLMLLDHQGQLYIHSSRGFHDDFYRSYRVRIGEGIAGKVAENREPVLVTDIERDERFRGSRRDRYKTRSFISCPIMGQDELLGVLNINDKKSGRHFNEDEFSLVRVLAGQAALALKKAFLLEKFQEKMIYAEELNRKLIDADIAKTDFLTRLSHELRTPLNSIVGAVYYLKNTLSENSDGQGEFLRIIENEAGRLTSILEKQLDFLRMEDESRVIRKAIIPLAELLPEVVDSYTVRTTLEQHKFNLEFFPVDDRADIVGDRAQISQLFFNLLQGLAGHVSKGSALRLVVRAGTSVEVTLQSSEKLPSARVGNLFNARDDFGRQKTTPGLYLYLARKAVEANGWQIEAANGLEGVFCRVRIPRVDLEMEEAALDMTMGRMLEFVSGMLDAKTSSLMLCDQFSGDLVIRSSRGLEEKVVRGTRLKLGDRLAGWVAAEGKPLLVEDIERDPRFGSSYFSAQYSSRSLLSVPLKSRGRVIGVLNFTDKQAEEPFSEKDLRLAKVMVERIAAFIDNLKEQAGRNENDFRKVIASLDSLLAAKNRYGKRNRRYPELVDALMTRLNAEEKDRELALYTALIYDLGLVLLDRSLLEKKQQLSSREISSLHNHPYSTLELLQDFESSPDVKTVILHHHEHFDGSGYPDGLKGEEIPFTSRVLAVVDGYCAMLEDRPYRPAMSQEEALGHIREGAGTQYDPQVVEALERVVL